MTLHGIVVVYEYEPDSLGDIPANAFEAELYDALKKQWPGALIDIRAHGTRVWGETDDGQDIPEGEIRQIAGDVFNKLCVELDPD